MPNLNVDFGGATLIEPGAYYTDDVSAALQTTTALVPPLVWLAYSYGGQPNVPATFTTSQDVVSFLRGAPATDMVPFIFNPSNELNGASVVTVIPVGANTQGTFSYTNSASASVLTVETVGYGLPSNLMQTSVVSGSTAGVEITLFDGFTGNSTYADNLGVPLQIAYAGSATGVTFTVAQTAAAATILSTTGAPAGHNVSIALGGGGYSNITEVAEYLNGTGFYAAQVLSSGPSYSHGNLPSSLLDAAATVSLPAATVSGNTFVSVTASLTDIQYWMNNAAANFVINAALVTTSSPANLPAPLPLTHFSGGTSVPPTLGSYAAALNTALTVPAWVVIADQNVPGLPALLAQHAVTASSIPYRSWRRAVSGSNIGDSVASAVTMAQSLNAAQMSYVYPGVYRNSQLTGNNTLYGGYYQAAAAAGIMAGNPVTTPLTHKTLVGNGVEVALSVTQVNTLQQGGVMPVGTLGNTGVPMIISDFTTWQNDANPENVFSQQVACRQYLGYVMIAAMDPYTGTVQSSFGITNEKKAATAALNAQVVTATSPGVLNSWNASTLQLNYSGAQQLTSVTFQCAFVGQNRFITIEAFVQPLNLSA